VEVIAVSRRFPPIRLSPRRICIALGYAALLAVLGCKASEPDKLESAYVSAVQATLRDRVAAVYNRTGIVSNGERVQILERSKNGRFARVRSVRNEEGWLEVRYLAGDDVFNAFQRLSRENATVPSQAIALAKSDLNMHLEPSRDAEHLFQLKQGEKLELLKRASSVKGGKQAAPVPPPAAMQAGKAVAPQAAPLPVAYEDWWLVRDPQKRCGWVLSRMVDMDVPLEVAQYAEGQRIMAVFVLNTVADKDKRVPQYLLLLNQPRDGTPQDFDQIRVFTWNAHRQHYETAYREHPVEGMLPASAGIDDFGAREGKLPVFSVMLRDRTGTLNERKYKLNGVMVRRVLAAGETPPPRAGHKRKKAS